MSTWGRATYGDPCRQCGYAWPDELDLMIDVVRLTPPKMRLAIGTTEGTGRDPALEWDARSYVCHVVDNLRIWAERLAAAIGVPEQPVGTYDADPARDRAGLFDSPSPRSALVLGGRRRRLDPGRRRLAPLRRDAKPSRTRHTSRCRRRIDQCT